MTSKMSIVQMKSNDSLLLVEQILENLSENIAQRVMNKVAGFLESVQPNPQEEKEEYYTIKETCEILKVSRTTLHNWNKREVFVSDAWKGRPMYTKSNIERFLSGKEPTL